MDQISYFEMEVTTRFLTQGAGHSQFYAPVHVKSQGGEGRGYPREFDSANFPWVRILTHGDSPWAGNLKFRLSHYVHHLYCCKHHSRLEMLPKGKNFHRDGNLTFTRCPDEGNLTLASMKMSNALGWVCPCCLSR